MNYVLLGCRIKERRIAQKMTQEELAFQVDTSATYISHVERATKKLSLEKLIDIADALKVPVSSLLVGNEKYTEKDYNEEIHDLLKDYSTLDQQVIIDSLEVIINILQNIH